MKEPILITGCARSGTSMVAGIINKCQVFGGDMSGPNRNNAKGMFENAYIRNNILKPYLRQMEVDPLGQYPLPDIDNLLIPSSLKKDVEQVMINQGYTNGPWMYKGAKMCLTWPAWHHAFPNAKWIIVRRRTGDIVNSCIRTGFMRAFHRKEVQKAVGVTNERDGWIWWVHQHEKRFIEMMESEEGVNVKVIWPHRMVNGDYTQIKDMIDWLGLKWNTEILNFVDPLLWHARNKQK